MRCIRTALAVLLLAAVPTLAAAAAEEACVLKGGETILFFGDSITQGGAYVEDVEAFLLTRFPDKRFRIVNAGISSETISGTSEPDHDPRRPWAHQRFDRDVAAARPDIVVACFGMNDGNYHPFDHLKFRKYRAGVRRLIDRCKRIGARTVFLTPPPFDPYRRRAGDPGAVHYGYRYPAVDYDVTLEVYSDFLVGLRPEGFLVAPVHDAMNRHLRERRKEKVSFYLSGDAVHPNATGHWLMAQTLLETLRVPADVAHAEIDAKAMKVVAGDVKGLKKENGGIAFTWTTPLPMPVDPAWDAKSLQVERTFDRLSRYTLTVTGLDAGRYHLHASHVKAGYVTAADLSAGIDLNAVADWPLTVVAKQVLALVRKRRRTIYKAWRQGLRTGKEGAGQDAIRKAEADTADRLRFAHATATPMRLEVRLVPAK
ncbi:MAG: SGNH/GDSL hydrolase family protein [Phycisphaerae bacterium]